MSPFHKPPVDRAYSLVEILVVIGILSVILVLGYRSLSFFTQETAQLSRAAVSSRKAEFDRFVGVLNDRLSQAWAFSTGSSTYNGLNGTQIALLDHEGTNYANFSLYSDGMIYVYRLQDITVASMLDLTYAFTNRESTIDYNLVLTTNAALPGTANVTAVWKIPPPFYYTAATEAFRSLFVYRDDPDLESKVSQHRTNKTGLLQHDLRTYTFNPRHEAVR
jgi:prepilin-type N-terminal cleavage/methylation domain-containing protein